MHTCIHTYTNALTRHVDREYITLHAKSYEHTNVLVHTHMHLLHADTYTCPSVIDIDCCMLYIYLRARAHYTLRSNTKTQKQRSHEQIVTCRAGPKKKVVMSEFCTLWQNI